MHTEAALRPASTSAGPVANRHLGLAAAIVEIGTPPRMKRLGSFDLRRSTLPPVSPQFRRLWFLAVITAMENGGRMSLAEAYLDNARVLFPHDAEILLLSGIAEEMRGVEPPRRRQRGRTPQGARATRRRTCARRWRSRRIGLETRLRLGRVLAQRGHADEARPLLTAVADVPDDRLAYLACALPRRPGGRAPATRPPPRAGTRGPRRGCRRRRRRGSPASELQHRAGERHEAAAALPRRRSAPDNTTTRGGRYLFGEYWRIDLYLDAMRQMARS